MRSKLDNWLLVIAGPDEFNHAARIAELIKEQEMERWVRVVGPLYGQQKRDAFAAASFFVLPSYSESFSNVVLEALGAGVPRCSRRRECLGPNLRHTTAAGGLKQPKMASLLR